MQVLYSTILEIFLAEIHITQGCVDSLELVQQSCQDLTSVAETMTRLTNV